HAQRVSVVGDFNAWDGRLHPMRVRGTTGVWELFFPELGAGERYRFEIKSRVGRFLATKSNPYGCAFELRPNTATIVCDVDAYEWHDQTWTAARPQSDWQHAPLSVYEVHLGSWMHVPEAGNRWLTYRELAPKLVS